MAFFSLIIALLIEQARPLPVDRLVKAPLRFLSRGVVQRLNKQPGALVWSLLVASATVLTALVCYLLWELHPVLAFAFNIAVLYLTMGFRQENHFFSDIHLALRMGELDRARALLGEWRGGHYQEAGASEVARLAIEQALVAAHRNVFGVAFWFVLLPGASGAVMYRLACFLADEWGRSATPEAVELGRFARRAFEAIDFVPVRLTAASFSVAGDFEDALYCWRTQAVMWPDRSSAILIASGAGALGVRLGMPIHESGQIIDRPEMGQDDDANVDHMQSTVGLVWRALLVCLFLLALLGLAGWVGNLSIS